MAEVRETQAIEDLTSKESSAISNSDTLLVINSSEGGYQATTQNLGDHMIQNARSNLNGKTQTVASAIGEVNGKLPSDNGTNNQILRSNGDGTSRWDNAASASEIGAAVTEWLEENIAGGQTIAIDDSLTVEDAAADAKAVGDAIDAVEQEVDELKSDLSETEPIFKDYFKTEQHTNVTTNNMAWTEGKYFDINTGEEKSLNGYSHTEKFPCDASDIIGIGLNTGQVLFWGANGYLSFVPTSPSIAMQITAPIGATEYACNNRDVNYRPNATTVSKTTETESLIAKVYDAPAQALSVDFENKKYASTANGNLYSGDSYASYYCAYRFPCKPSHKYRTSTHTQVIFYNDSKEFISAYVPTIDGYNATGVKVEMEFETPANCAYISINSNASNEIIFDSEYTVFGNEKTAYPLIGKTVVCFGDSITGNYYFGDNYPYQIEEKTGAKVYDVGFGGCRMELTNESSIQYVNPFSMVSLADAIVSDQADKWSNQDTNANSFALKNMVKARLAILKSIDFSTVDIVTIAYGTNGIGLPIENGSDPLDTYSYAGATRYAIKTLLTKYPHLRIVLLTPIYRWYSETLDDGDTHQIGGQTLLDRVTKLLEVGSEIKIPTIDLYHTLGINKYNYTGYFGDDDETADGTHINSFGRKQMGLRVAGELNCLF